MVKKVNAGNLSLFENLQFYVLYVKNLPKMTF